MVQPGFGAAPISSFGSSGGGLNNFRNRRRKLFNRVLGEQDDFTEAFTSDFGGGFNRPINSPSTFGGPGSEDFNSPFGDPQEGFGSDAFPSFKLPKQLSETNFNKGPQIIPPRLFGATREEKETIPFFGALERADLTPNARDFFKTRANQVFNRFQGKLDEAIRSGRPDPRFVDFINDFDFQRAFQDSPSFGGRSAPIQRVIRR